MAATQTATQGVKLSDVYDTRQLAAFAFAAMAAAVLIAGFWNYHLVDGFGRDVIAAPALGDTSDVVGTFQERGLGFGFIFAAVAGLAATFTACNCVVFAMLPGLACSTDQRSNVRASNPWTALGVFVLGVTLVCAAYGAYVGLLGSGVEAFNERSARLSQAQIVFTALGAAMLIWGLFELGFLDAVERRIPEHVRSFFGDMRTKAALLGLFVGLFAVGRPFPVFREFLAYAASANSPLYGAGVMIVQGAGQILVMVLLFSIVVGLAGKRIIRWSSAQPHKPKLTSGLALLAGGTFFIFYWGLAFAFDIGGWGFKLGWY